MKFPDLIFVFESITLLIALFQFKKYKSNFYTFFILFVFFACLTELLGSLLSDGKTSTVWLYNIYTFFEFTSILGIYFFLNNGKNSKQIIILLAVIFYIIYGLSFKFVKLQNYTVIILPFFATPFMFLYLKHLLNSNQIINYKKELPFWLTVGFLIYYIGTVPFFSLLYIGGMRNRILFTLLTSIVLIMHIVFMGSLLWSKPTQKLSS